MEASSKIEIAPDYRESTVFNEKISYEPGTVVRISNNHLANMAQVDIISSVVTEISK